MTKYARFQCNLQTLAIFRLLEEPVFYVQLDDMLRCMSLLKAVSKKGHSSLPPVPLCSLTSPSCGHCSDCKMNQFSLLVLCKFVFSAWLVKGQDSKLSHYMCLSFVLNFTEAQTVGCNIAQTEGQRFYWALEHSVCTAWQWYSTQLCCADFSSSWPSVLRLISNFTSKIKCHWFRNSINESFHAYYALP